MTVCILSVTSEGQSLTLRMSWKKRKGVGGLQA